MNKEEELKQAQIDNLNAQSELLRAQATELNLKNKANGSKT
jgi:hypothetical protein